ncbi:type IV secretory system conjugative DNA transfer family protein [Bdellovibrio sp. HCB-162]|uniref:type IV secretory system conjugative DNA transfer family protein n=1 Tax=Bdellovibrio sp. HCB-162 TaxID=3394234 RepID=UPI0039BC7489
MKQFFNFKKLFSPFLESLGLPLSDSDIYIGKIKGSFFRKEYLSEEELNHHVHVVGASGFGKTVLLSKILKSRLQKGSGALWIDLKGERETIEKMIGTVKSLGREKDLKIFSISHPNISTSYNIIRRGDATEIRDKIFGCFKWGDEFYKNEAFSYLLKILTGLVWLRDNAQKEFDLEILLNACSDVSFVEELCLAIPNSEMAVKRNLESCYSYLNNKDTYGYIAGLRSQLESLVLSSFGKFLKAQPEGINLFDEVNNQKIVFIFLDSRRYKETTKVIGRLIVQDIISTSAKIDADIPRNERKFFNCIIDEFADLAEDYFLGFPDRARSSKVTLTLAHQEMADLRAVSDEFEERLTGNVSTLYAFLQPNQTSAEIVSKRGGTKTVWKETHKAQRLGPITLKTGDKSLREVEEFNIHPNVVKSLRVGECVVVKKYPYSRAHVVRVDEN